MSWHWKFSFESTGGVPVFYSRPSKSVLLYLYSNSKEINQGIRNENSVCISLGNTFQTSEGTSFACLNNSTEVCELQDETTDILVHKDTFSLSHRGTNADLRLTAKDLETVHPAPKLQRKSRLWLATAQGIKNPSIWIF